MNRSQANRRTIAARTTAPASRPVGRPATDIRARTITETERAIPATRNRKSSRLTATQRNSEGRKSEWSASPYYFTAPAWDQTISNQDDRRR